MISNDVLEAEQESVQKQIQQYAAQRKEPPEDLVDRKQQIDLKLNLLQIQVQTGQLTMEAYMEQLQQKIENERKTAAQLVKAGKREWAKLALVRVKIMEKELASAEEEEPEE